MISEQNKNKWQNIIDKLEEYIPKEKLNDHKDHIDHDAQAIKGPNQQTTEVESDMQSDIREVKSTVGLTMIVPIKISGEQVPAVIDTAAQI